MSNQSQSKSQREYPLGVKSYKASVERSPAMKKAAEAIRAIDHPLRSQIVAFLESNPNSCVTDIYIKLRLEQSVASQHLRILRDAGLVEATRIGKNFLYRVKERKDLVVALAKSF